MLNSVKDHEGETFLPAVSVFAAIIIAITGMVLLVVFIHHISVSIQSNKVVADIAASMLINVRDLYPGHIGEECPDDRPAFSADRYAHRVEVKVREGGYLKSVDGNALIELAVREDVVVRLLRRPGDYLVAGNLLCVVHSDTSIGDDFSEKVIKLFITGKVRSAFQDAEFSIHQMVEVAGRALSPGINDPNTAIACIDNLTSVMCYLTSVKYPSTHRLDGEGKLRLVANSLDFSGMLEASFSQIRQYGEDTPAVIIRMMESTATLLKFAAGDAQRKAVQAHADMLMRCGERSFKEKSDLEDLQKRYFAMQ